MLPDGGEDHSRLVELLRSVAPPERDPPSPPPHPPPRGPVVPPQYREWLSARCGEVELIGMDLTHGSGVRLNHVYTPLTTNAAPEFTIHRAARE